MSWTSSNPRKVKTIVVRNLLNMLLIKLSNSVCWRLYFFAQYTRVPYFCALHVYAAQRCAADLQGHAAQCAVSHTCSAAHKVYRSADMERIAHGAQRVQHRALSTQRAQHVPSAAPMLSAGQCAAPRRAVRIRAAAELRPMHAHCAPYMRCAHCAAPCSAHVRCG